MAVVIRLQGLRVTAGSEDIRRFFTGLKIPDGGVHIIGGELDEAFIIFASDEDARRAMTRSGGVIRGSPVRLLLSSKAEMDTVLERTTETMEADQQRKIENEPRFSHRSMEPEVEWRSSDRPESYVSSQDQRNLDTESFFIVFLNGLPFSVTERNIREFFDGLLIDEIVLVKNHKGENNGKGFVKFATRQDCIESLKRDKNYIGSRYIDVCTTTVYEWFRATGRMPTMSCTGDNFERGRSPVRGQRNVQLHARSRSPVALGHDVPSAENYCVMLDNLSYSVVKEDIKELFHNARLKLDQIYPLTEIGGNKTRSAFVLFKNLQDYHDALGHDQREHFGRVLQVSSISRENMISFLESRRVDVRHPGDPERGQERSPSYPRDFYDSEKVCVFVRNLPFDVRKVEIIDFFQGFNVSEDKVWVLHDHKGSGIGQTLVLFGSEAEAVRALSLNGRRFLGSEVTMKCISRSQMNQLTADLPLVQESLPKKESYSDRRSRSIEVSYRPGDTLYPDLRNPKDGNSPLANVQGHIHGSGNYEPHSPQYRGSEVHGKFGSSMQDFDDPTCVQLMNLPFLIRNEEIYDFCYGYRVIPGSVKVQCDQTGKRNGCATLEFESRQEALTAIRELSGRPIGPRRIQLMLA
ncbi:RNA binding motif protein 12Bb isoform X2 [Cololabis saira]|nr:RNA binding motif protein 12Bb isoform X2 [Cololabis saira]XP_061572718.1 RNA binding motif protein 12Bb isoform X2 [Cololabis saira]